MTDSEKLFHEIAAELPDSIEGKMFGALCIKAANGKAGIMFKNDVMVFKLDEEDLREALSLPGAKLFDPAGGRPMKEWVQVPFEYSDKWRAYASKGMKKASMEKAKK